MEDHAFKFVCSPPVQLTAELTQQITDANAWVQLIPTGSNVPIRDAGAFVPDSFTEIKNNIESVRTELRNEMKKNKKEQEETNYLLATHIANINNLLKEKEILIVNNKRLEDAHSVLFNCQICFDNHRQVRFHPCGHTVTCDECGNKILNSVDVSQRVCPICRTTLVGLQRVYL